MSLSSFLVNWSVRVQFENLCGRVCFRTWRGEHVFENSHKIKYLCVCVCVSTWSGLREVVEYKRGVL